MKLHIRNAKPTLCVPGILPSEMHEAQTFNTPMYLNVQEYEQTSLQAVLVLLQDTIRQNRLTQETHSQSIWKYDCSSTTNQRHCKAHS